MRKLTLDDFLERAGSAHGDKYDYSRVQYKRNDVKVEIICASHGAFWQAPNKHFMGRGCPECGDAAKGQYRVPTTEEFVSQLREVHGDLFDYSRVQYTGMKSKIEIGCRLHGIFSQAAWEHKQGSICPLCFSERSRNNIWPHTMYHEDGNTSKIYVMHFSNSNESFIKVGVSVAPHDRMVHLNRNAGREYEITLLEEVEGCARKVLRCELDTLHNKFKDFRHTPARVFPGSTECLKLDVADEVIQHIQNQMI